MLIVSLLLKYLQKVQIYVWAIWWCLYHFLCLQWNQNVRFPSTECSITHGNREQYQNFVLTHFFLTHENVLATSLSRNMVANSSFLFELELNKCLDMTTSKAHIISTLITRVLFVQESIKDCLQEDSGCLADVLS